MTAAVVSIALHRSRGLFLLLLLLRIVGDDDEPTPGHVALPNGTVVGHPLTVGRRQVWRFLGIPYAEPPVGDLRFRPPEPLRRPWASPLVADRMPYACVQRTYHGPYDWPQETVPQAVSEDCLHLNVWTPAPFVGRSRAVMVWLHSHDFSTGSPLPLYDGRVLSAEGDVVVVSIQFRIGILGFLRLDDSVPGNWALLDQQLALRWIHEAAPKFGGDPARITIFGLSSGSAMASLHLLLAGSAPYFRRAILHSGAATNPRHFNEHSAATATAFRRLAQERLGCDHEDTPELMQCLRGVGAAEILRVQHDVQVMDGSHAVWRSIVDGQLFDRPAAEVLRSGRLQPKDLMLGVTSDEGGLFASRIMQSYLGRHFQEEATADHVSDLALNGLVMETFPDFPQFPHKTSPEATKLLQRRSRSGNGRTNMRRLSDLYGQFHCYCGVNRFIDAYRRRSNKSVYYYQFDHRSSFSSYLDWVGAAHGDEIFYVFGLSRIYPHLENYTTEREERLIDDMIAEWSDFAKTGRPASQAWRPFSEERKEYFRLGLSPGPEENGMWREECVLWDQILPALNSSEHRR